MALQDDFRRCLIDLDVKGARGIWAKAAPQLPQPATDAEALMTMHAARLAMKTIPARLRDYSRAWLEERAAQPIYAFGVGIAVDAPAHRRAQAVAMQSAMSQAVLDAVQAGVSIEHESEEITRRMIIARDRA